MDWNHMDYLWIIVMFQLFGLSFWRHPFTAEDQFVSKWCNDKFLKIRSDEETIHLYFGWPEGEDIFSKFRFLGELFL